VAGFAFGVVGFAIVALVVAGAFGCGASTAAGELDGDDCDTDADGDADEAPDGAVGDADDDCDGDGDGDVDAVDDAVDGPRSWPLAWSAVLALGLEAEAHELATLESTITVWPDGRARFELLAYAPHHRARVRLQLELAHGLQPGRHCTYPGCDDGLSATLTVTATEEATAPGCDASGAESVALGYLSIAGLELGDEVTFAFQFEGVDGCRAQVFEGAISGR
jgi:hypothetical protein